MCGWGSRCLSLYCSCPVTDSAAQNYYHQVRSSEINYLLTHFAFGVAVPRRYLANTPSICGPFEEYVLPQHLLSGRVKGYKHFAMWWC